MPDSFSGLQKNQHLATKTGEKTGLVSCQAWLDPPVFPAPQRHLLPFFIFPVVVWSNLAEKRERRKTGIEKAIQHFEKSAGRRALSNNCSVIAMDEKRCIVRLCYVEDPPRKPMSRRYFAVHQPLGWVEELDFDHVAEKYGEKPWR